MRLLRFLCGKVEAALCKRAILGEYHGVRICDLNFNDDDNQRFLKETKRVLDLIAVRDPRRFHRVQRHIRYLLNCELYSGAGYAPGQVCKIDFGRFDFRKNPKGCFYVYAGMLVHEATHGLLRSKGFGRTKANWVQVERICCAEQNRFLAKVERDYGAPLQREFDPRRWDFGSWWQRLSALFGRVKAERLKEEKGSRRSG